MASRSRKMAPPNRQPRRVQSDERRLAKPRGTSIIVTVRLYKAPRGIRKNRNTATGGDVDTGRKGEDGTSRFLGRKGSKAFGHYRLRIGPAAGIFPRFGRHRVLGNGGRAVPRRHERMDRSFHHYFVGSVGNPLADHSLHDPT
jgi:hypothetical protein